MIGTGHSLLEVWAIWVVGSLACVAGPPVRVAPWALGVGGSYQSSPGYLRPAEKTDSDLFENSAELV